MKQYLLAFTAFLLSSCTSMNNLDTFSLNTGTEGFDLPVNPINKEVSDSDLVGTYRFGDGFWNWEIHLEEDMTFAHVWISDTLVEDDEGKIGFESGVDIDGQWSLDGNAVVLSYEEKEIYRLVRVGKHLSLIEPILRSNFHRVYVKTDTPLTFRDKEKPNQAVDAMPTNARLFHSTTSEFNDPRNGPQAGVGIASL